MLEEINGLIKEAMKSKSKDRLQHLRYLKSMLMENQTSAKPKAEMDVVISHAKKLKDSLESYPDGHDMRSGIEEEIKTVTEFLPQPLTEEEVKSLITTIKSELDAPNMGMIMKALQPQIKGKFDGKKASQLVNESLKG